MASVAIGSVTPGQLLGAAGSVELAVRALAIKDNPGVRSKDHGLCWDADFRRDRRLLILGKFIAQPAVGGLTPRVRHFKTEVLRVP
jgi:hypothetical protein